MEVNTLTRSKKIQLLKLLEEKQRREQNKALALKCRDSLYEFLCYFWDTLISEKMHDNWHLKALCDELQPHLLRAIRREKKEADIVVNIAPGTTKSTIISQMIPAWCWTVRAETIILTSTNSDKLTAKNAMRSKDIITSKKYKELYPDIIIRKDASAKTFYQNSLGGARYSFTTKGSKIGNHGDILIEDDPTTSKQSKSEAEMEAAEEGFKEFQTRKTNKESSLYILLMQRLSIQDYTTIAMKKLSNVYHICLPAEDSVLVKPEKFRSQYINGLLDPVRLSKEQLKKEKQALNSDEEGTTSDDYPAQFEQDPKASEGLVYNLQYYDKITNQAGAISYCFVDVADSGDDYLCVVFVKIIGNKVFVIDAMYTQEGSETSAERLANMIRLYGCTITIVETNNQGSTYATLLKKYRALGIKGVYSTGNKMRRIIANSWIIDKAFRFKKEGSDEYNRYLRRMQTILKTSKKEDDCADATTIGAMAIFGSHPELLLD